MESLDSFSTIGLMPDALLSIISQIESKDLCTPEKIKLMESLIPLVSVPEEAFIRMTCLLCDSNLSFDLKIEILKWMNSVYSFVDDMSNFINLIEIFFNLLEFETLLPHICLLLFKMSRPEHITMDRMNRVSNLTEKFESQSCLISLMYFYLRQTNAIKFEPKQDIEYHFEDLGIYPNLIKEVHPSYDNFIPAYHVVNNDTKPLPPFCIGVEKSSQPEAHPTNERSLATQTNIENEFLEIYKEFECMQKQKIEKILQNKYIRLFFNPHISQVKKTSLKDFILASMHKNLKKVDFLFDILKIFYEIQKSVPGICEITEQIIKEQEDWDIVFVMLTFEPLCCFEKFQNLFDLIVIKLTNSRDFEKYDFLNGLSNLYQEWVLRDQDFTSSCKNCNFSTNSSSAVVDNQSVTDEIHKLGNYFIMISDEFLLHNNFHIGLLNEILLHNERVSRCHLTVNNLVIHPLSTISFHSALFTRNTVILESLCSLFIRYKEEIQTMKLLKHPEYRLSKIYFKRYCNDFSQLLLKGQYNKEIITHLSKNKVLSRLAAVKPRFGKYFDVFRHPALIHLYVDYKNTENPGQNIPQARDYFIKCLEQNGKEMFKFLQWLMDRK